MPKKGKGKQPSGAGAAAEKTPKRPAAPEPLPQVWLPNQPDPSLFDDSSAPEEATGLPPSQHEQDQVALFWAMEEANTQRGWDEEKEIDYTELSRRQEERVTKEVTEGNPELFKYAQSSVFPVKYLGCLCNLQSHRGSETQTDILESIDIAQRQGRLPWVTSEQDQRVLSVSKYGIKVMDVKKQRVYTRHALHCMANITYYEDTYRKHMLAVRSGRPDVEQFDLYIYECNDETEAKDICLTLAQAFEAVFNKIKLEQNLHASELR